jgi:hypothetical protein
MTALDTSPTSPDVVDHLTELLEELETAGGEIVITAVAHYQRPVRWTVQLLTDWRGPGRPCDHGAQESGRYLADAVDAAVSSLRADQAVTVAGAR